MTHPPKVLVRKILVLGAGGHTGQFVVEELHRRGAIPVPATRSGRFVSISGSEESCAAVDATRPDQLDLLCAGVDAIINCAGPFFDTALPVAEAAIRHRIPYLDVSAEQWTVKRLFDQLDARAQMAGVTLIPAMAFFGGLADLLASSLIQTGEAVESINIAVGLDSWHPTSGTRLTGERNTHPRQIVRGGQLVDVPSPAPERNWDFPVPIGKQLVTCVPLSEIILLSRHSGAESITSYMNLKPLNDLRDKTTPPPLARDALGRSDQHFVIDVEVMSHGEMRRAQVQGRDIYAISAPLVASAAMQLLDHLGTLAGVRSPSEIFDPVPFLKSIGPDLAAEFLS